MYESGSSAVATGQCLLHGWHSGPFCPSCSTFVPPAPSAAPLPGAPVVHVHIPTYVPPEGPAACLIAVDAARLERLEQLVAELVEILRD